MKNYTSYLNAFLDFSASPNQEKIANTCFYSKIRYTKYSFFLILLSSFLAALVTVLMEKSGVMPRFQNFADSSVINKYGIIGFYIISIIGAPVIEELAFRTLLVFSKINLTISSGFLFYTLACSFTGFRYSLSHPIAYYNILGSCFCATLMWYYLSNKENYSKLNYLWKSHFPIVFYSSVLLFAYLHLFNFGEITIIKIIFSPFIVLQFFICAIIFGHARIKLGLHWAIILHMMLNGFVTLIQSLRTLA
ncbi:CPBP family intramembrane metalloprotease [Pontibacter sp. JH31]|uniref:CPBP family intramembrane metalloprotease n=1 Tax=Pontibacter aquaedesilientis TaxID=2766980 RepID=A0ABR7XKW3_9BACT|nr:CPBP family glutamic-type intramembrane protease [Pontibacter aquaedesilientis]MBD1398928.1 CPBP family intramembrane metalloprotease [Pontibacter aquaedesilientis]